MDKQGSGVIIYNWARKQVPLILVGSVSEGEQPSGCKHLERRKLWWTFSAYTVNIHSWAQEGRFCFAADLRHRDPWHICANESPIHQGLHWLPVFPSVELMDCSPRGPAVLRTIAFSVWLGHGVVTKAPVRLWSLAWPVYQQRNCRSR